MSWEVPDGDEIGPRRPWLELIGGIAAVLVLHLAVGLALWSLAWGADLAGTGRLRGQLYELLLMWMGTVGLSQLIYVLPAFVVALLWRRRVAAGIAVGAALTLLLQGACYGVFCATISL